MGKAISQFDKKNKEKMDKMEGRLANKLMRLRPTLITLRNLAVFYKPRYKLKNKKYNYTVLAASDITFYINEVVKDVFTKNNKHVFRHNSSSFVNFYFNKNKAFNKNLPLVMEGFNFNKLCSFFKFKDCFSISSTRKLLLNYYENNIYKEELKTTTYLDYVDRFTGHTGLSKEQSTEYLRLIDMKFSKFITDRGAFILYPSCTIDTDLYFFPDIHKNNLLHEARAMVRAMLKFCCALKEAQGKLTKSDYLYFTLTNQDIAKAVASGSPVEPDFSAVVCTKTFEKAMCAMSMFPYTEYYLCRVYHPEKSLTGYLPKTIKKEDIEYLYKKHKHPYLIIIELLKDVGDVSNHLYTVYKRSKPGRFGFEVDPRFISKSMRASTTLYYKNSLKFIHNGKQYNQLLCRWDDYGCEQSSTECSNKSDTDKCS